MEGDRLSEVGMKISAQDNRLETSTQELSNLKGLVIGGELGDLAKLGRDGEFLPGVVARAPYTLAGEYWTICDDSTRRRPSVP